MHDQEILAATDQQRLHDTSLREQIGKVTGEKDREFATNLVERVLGTRTQTVKQAAITWVIQHLGSF